MMNARTTGASNYDVTGNPYWVTTSPKDFNVLLRDLVACEEIRANTSINYFNYSSSFLSNCSTNTTQVAGFGLRHRYPDVRPVTIAMFLLTFIFGMTGNTLVIYVIGKYEKIRIRSVSNYYIWNLAFADVLFVVTLPFFCFATFANNWPFGSFVCKLLTVFRESNKFASVLTLVALSIDRFLATFHQFGRFRQIKNGIAACVIIWMICLVISTPYWLYSDVVVTTNQLRSCTLRWPNLSNFSGRDFHKLWTYIQLTFGLLVPFSIIATFSVLLLRRMRSRIAGKAGAQKKATVSLTAPRSGLTAIEANNTSQTTTNRLLRRNQANSSMTRVVLVIVVMFGVCHLPYHVNEVVAVWIIGNQMTNSLVISALIYVNVIAQLLVFIASCSNPIIYGVLNKNYRDLYKKTLCCCRCCGSSNKNGNTRLPAITNESPSRNDMNGKSRRQGRRGTDFFQVDTMPSVIAEMKTCRVPETGKGEVVQSCVYLDVHNIDEKMSPTSTCGGTITYQVDASEIAFDG